MYFLLHRRSSRLQGLRLLLHSAKIFFFAWSIWEVALAKYMLLVGVLLNPDMQFAPSPSLHGKRNPRSYQASTSRFA